MIEQGELNWAFFCKIWQAEPSFLEGMASRAELFCPKAQAKTEPSRAELRLGPNTSIYIVPELKTWEIWILLLRKKIVKTKRVIWGNNVKVLPSHELNAIKVKVFYMMNCNLDYSHTLSFKGGLGCFKLSIAELSEFGPIFTKWFFS